MAENLPDITDLPRRAAMKASAPDLQARSSSQAGSSSRRPPPASSVPALAGRPSLASRDAAVAQLMNTISGMMDDEILENAILEGNRLVETFRAAWLDAVEALQVLNITVLWRAHLGRLPKAEEIQAIMSYAARVTVDEWTASGHSGDSPGISRELTKAGEQVYDRFGKLRDAERELTAKAPLGRQPEPMQPGAPVESTSDVLAVEPEKKRRKKTKPSKDTAGGA